MMMTIVYILKFLKLNKKIISNIAARALIKNNIQKDILKLSESGLILKLIIRDTKGISTKSIAGIYRRKEEYCLSIIFEKANKNTNRTSGIENKVDIALVIISNFFEGFIDVRWPYSF